MNQEKAIFIHSLFRAGSTYLFNKFREKNSFCTYYEPLHHDLARLEKDSLDIYKRDEIAAKAMNHPTLNKPHFYEFENAFNDISTSLPYYDTDFAYKEFFKVEKHQELKTYIDHLIHSAPKSSIPVFQFNRSSCRIDWFKEEYPQSLNIFLLRNPRDQFESYVSRGKLGKNVFLAINLYIVLYNKTAMQYLFHKKPNISFSGDTQQDLQVCFKLSTKLPLKKHYEIFYYIWKYSTLHAEKYADLIIDMDKLNDNIDYMNKIKHTLSEYSNIPINFDDYKIKQNTKYSLKDTVFSNIEQSINQDFGYDINGNLKINIKLQTSGFINTL